VQDRSLSGIGADGRQANVKAAIRSEGERDREHEVRRHRLRAGRLVWRTTRPLPGTKTGGSAVVFADISAA
jgi:hypothetical protein